LTGRLPPDAGQIVVMHGNQLEVARTTVKTIRVLSYLLSFLVLALFVGAVWIARQRRRTTLLAIGVSLVIVGMLVLVARRFGGNYLVDALTTNPDAKRPVSAAWAIGTELLRNVGVNVVIYGLLTVLGAWIAGPSRLAVALRRRAAPTLSERPVVVYGALASALLLLLLSGPTDGQRIYPLLLLFVFAFIGVEVLRRQARREFVTQPSLSP
jgi:drug/metabolite transporter (DMT)-like permease